MIDLAKYGSCTLAGDGCATCGDVAVPVRVLSIGNGGTATCEDRVGARAEIMIEFTPDAAPGDVLMVHMGISIGKVETGEAANDPTEKLRTS